MCSGRASASPHTMTSNASTQMPSEMCGKSSSSPFGPPVPAGLVRGRPTGPLPSAGRDRPRAEAAASTSPGVLQLRQHLIDGEARCLLSRRKLLERCQKLSDQGLRRDEQEDVVHNPIVIGVRRDVGVLVRIGPQIEELRNSQMSEWFSPEFKCASGTLLGEYDLPVVIAQGQ